MTTTAINVSASAVELAAVNGAGLLPAASDHENHLGDHERELTEMTEREESLQRAGIIELRTATGRKRALKPAPDPEPADAPTGDAAA